jgi:hypothetical protein
MPVLQFGRYRDLAAAVAGRLASAETPLEVIVASSGVRQSVLAELLQRTPAGVTSIRLDGLEAFARRVVNDGGDYPRVASDGERRLAMRTAVRSIDDPILESRGVAAMLERSYRDTRDSGMTLPDFESRIRDFDSHINDVGSHMLGTRPLRNRMRTQLVLRVWREYERLIAALGCIDPADLLGRAAEGVKRVVHASQIVAGFYDMTGAQLRLVEALRDRGKLDALFIPATDDESYAFAKTLIARFQEDSALAPRPAAMEIKAPSYTIEAHRRATDELRAVCAEIAALLAAGENPRAIGIVARSLEPHDVDLVNRAAAEHGFATTAADELPLRTHRIGRGMATLLRLRERGFPRSGVFELLRDGLRTQRRIDLDRGDLETRKARIADGTSEELRPMSRRPIIDDYIAVVAELEALTTPLNAPMSGGEWSGFLSKATSLFKPETEQDLKAVDAVDAIAALFAGTTAWNTRFDITAVEDALAKPTLQQPGNQATQQPVVWLGDVMRMRGRTFEHLFAVRMQNDVFPQRRVDDPLLPDGPSAYARSATAATRSASSSNSYSTRPRRPSASPSPAATASAKLCVRRNS